VTAKIYTHKYTSRKTNDHNNSQSTAPYCATELPAENVRAPLGLFGRWS